jgi:tripartite-type tricarboxylate transporter receptor subunit TctC
MMVLVRVKDVQRVVLVIAMLASVLLTCTSTSAVAADTYPDKYIRLILPFPPGGGTDTLSRILAVKLRNSLGQTIIVDNRPGAAGNIATTIAAKAPKDGYTLLMGFSTALVVNPALYPDLTVNVERDFAPITLIAEAEYVLVVNPALKINSVADLIAYAKAHPGVLNYSSSGVGGPLHLAGALLASRAGIKLVHVPANGGGPSILSVLNGEAQMAFGSVASTLPFIKAGKLKALAVSGLQRSTVLPDLPTLDKSGFPGFNVVTWYGLLAPSGTPQPIIMKLHDEVIKTLADADVRQSMEREGLSPVGSAPQAFEERIKSETEEWAKIIKAFNIKVE